MWVPSVEMRKYVKVYVCEVPSKLSQLSSHNLRNSLTLRTGPSDDLWKEKEKKKFLHP